MVLEFKPIADIAAASKNASVAQNQSEFQSCSAQNLWVHPIMEPSSLDGAVPGDGP